jgi:hypothetical protein
MSTVGAAFRCWNCSRAIGKSADHWLLDGGRSAEVVCRHCVVHSNTRGTAQRVQGRAAAAALLRQVADQ